jgi:predicted transcriptional regulator
LNQNDSNSEFQNLNQNEAKRITLSVRVREEEYEKLREIAEATESSISRILRLAVRQYIKKWERAKDTG